MKKHKLSNVLGMFLNGVSLRAFIFGEFYKFTVCNLRNIIKGANFSVLFDFFRQLAVCQLVTVFAQLLSFAQ